MVKTKKEKTEEEKAKAREYARDYYEKNKERIREYNKKRQRKTTGRPVGRPTGTRFPNGYKKTEGGALRSPDSQSDIQLHTKEDVVELVLGSSRLVLG